jgi:hypothetical protein
MRAHARRRIDTWQKSTRKLVALFNLSDLNGLRVHGVRIQLPTGLDYVLMTDEMDGRATAVRRKITCNNI